MPMNELMSFIKQYDKLFANSHLEKYTDHELMVIKASIDTELIVQRENLQLPVLDHHRNESQLQVRWIEIPAIDFDRAFKFYSAVFGLLIEEHHFNGIRHGIFAAGPGLTAAIKKMESPKKNSEGPVLFFKLTWGMSPGMKEVTEKITLCGGKIIIPKTLIVDTLHEKGEVIVPRNYIDQQQGYYSVFLDSEGNKMALYSNY